MYLAELRVGGGAGASPSCRGLTCGAQLLDCTYIEIYSLGDKHAPSQSHRLAVERRQRTQTISYKKNIELK